VSSRFCLAFFIVSSFAVIGFAYAYDSNSVASICVRHNQQPSLLILAQQKETLLTRRVIRIRDRERQRIHEGRNCLSEGEAMFLAVRFIFGRIPFKRRPHSHSLPSA